MGKENPHHPRDNDAKCQTEQKQAKSQTKTVKQAGQNQYHTQLQFCQSKQTIKASNTEIIKATERTEFSTKKNPEKIINRYMYLTEKKKFQVQEILRNRKLFITEDRKEDIDMRSPLHDLDLPAQIPVRT